MAIASYLGDLQSAGGNDGFGCSGLDQAGLGNLLESDYVPNAIEQYAFCRESVASGSACASLRPIHLRPHALRARRGGKP